MWWTCCVGMAILIAVMLWDANANEKLPHQQAARLKTEVANIERDVKEMCIKGVKYYYTSGTHNSRMAPAIDAATLTFVRCE